MLKWFIRKRLTAFENEFGYDASYMRHVLDTDLGAFMRFARATQAMKYGKKLSPRLRCEPRSPRSRALRA